MLISAEMDLFAHIITLTSGHEKTKDWLVIFVVVEEENNETSHMLHLIFIAVKYLFFLFLQTKTKQINFHPLEKLRNTIWSRTKSHGIIIIGSVIECFVCVNVRNKLYNDHACAHLLAC